MEGHLAVATNVTIHFTADLSQWARDPEVLIRTIFNPDAGAPCVLVPVGPDTWGPQSREWVLHFISFPGDHKRYETDEALAAMRRGLGLPNFDPLVHVINRWPLDAVVASRFRVGRSFILGDAAHRMPPSGGHGLNSAVQDSYNLCWKIAAVLRGRAREELLESYEVERRPVAQRTVASAFSNWQNARHFAAALDFNPARSAGDMWDSLRRMWDGQGLEAEEARRRVRRGLAGSLPIYNHLNLSFGYSYDAGATVPDGSEPGPPTPDLTQIYQPSTRPGCSVPNAMLENLHDTAPLGDLLGRGRFVLIAGEEGAAWCDAARVVSAERGIELDAFSIGVSDGDYLDMRSEWLRLREIGPGGAILVRPDRFIAWRAMVMVQDPVMVLRHAFDRLLRPEARSVETPATTMESALT